MAREPLPRRNGPEIPSFRATSYSSMPYNIGASDHPEFNDFLAQIDAARLDVHLNHLQSALARTGPLISQLKRQWKRTGEATYNLLRASALTVAGQATRRIGDADANDFFRRAITILAPILENDGPAWAHRDLGVCYFEVGEHASAARALETAARLGDESAEGAYVRGLLAVRDERHADAHRLLTELVNAEHEPWVEPGLYDALARATEHVGSGPDAAQAYVDAGFVHVRSDDHAGALDAFAAAVRCDPTSSWARQLHAEALRLTGDAQAAIDELADDDSTIALGTKAAALIALGQAGDGVAMLEQAVDMDPDYAFAWETLAWARVELGDLDGALVATSRTLALDPTCAWAYTTRGDLLQRLERFPEALEALEDALEIDPNNVLAETLRAGVLLRLGRRQDAEASLRRARAGQTTPELVVLWADLLLKLDRLDDAVLLADAQTDADPGNAALWQLRGELLWRAERMAESQEAFNRVFELGVDDPVAHAITADILYKDGRLAEALDHADQALATMARYGFALSVKAAILSSSGDDVGALLAANGALDVDADDYFALGTRGEVLRRMGDLVGAEQALERSLEINPDYVFGLRQLAELHRDAGRDDVAIGFLDRLLAVDGTNVTALALRGDSLRSVYRLDEALASIDEALAIQPDSAFGHGTRGDILRLRGENDAAIAALNRAVELDPDYAFAWASRGECYRVLEQFEPAATDLDRALTAEPDNTFALTSSAIVSSELRKYERAMEHITRAMELEPAAPWVLALGGSIHLDLGEHERAIELLERSLEIDADSSQTHLWLGRASMNVRDYDRARRALSRACELDEENAYILSAIGDLELVLGRREDAHRRFTKAIDVLAKEPSPGYSAYWLTGWATFQLGKYDDALASILNTMSYRPGLTQLEFDFALTTLCSGRSETAIDEYERAAWFGGEREEPKRATAIARASMADLEQATVTHGIDDKDAIKKIRAILKQAARA